MLWAYSAPIFTTIVYYAGVLKGIYIYTDSSDYSSYITYFEADTDMNILFKRTYRVDSLYRWGVRNAYEMLLDDLGNMYVITVMLRYTGSYNVSPVVIKFDSVGNLLWANMYYFYPNDSCHSDWDAQMPAVLLKDGLLLGGQGDIGCNYLHDIILAKLDTSGNVIWAKLWRDRYSNFLASIVPSDSFGNSIYLIGTSDNVAIMKVDRNGNLLWMKIYDSPDYIDPGVDAAVLVGDKLIFGGKHTLGYYSLIKIDTFGIPYMRKYVNNIRGSGEVRNGWVWMDGYILTLNPLIKFDTNLNLLVDSLVDVALYDIVSSWGVSVGRNLVKVRLEPFGESCASLPRQYIYTSTAPPLPIKDFTDSVLVYDYDVNIINLPFVEVLPDTFSLTLECLVSVGEGGDISVLDGEVEVYDVSGRLIYKGYSDGISLKRGVYFLRKGKKVYKRIVR